MIVGVVLLAIIGFGAYRLVSRRTATGKPAAAPAAPGHGPREATGTAYALAHADLDDVVIQLTATEDCWVQLTSSRTDRRSTWA